MNKTIITLTGPSCSGKSTLEKMLKAQGFASAISTTTRAPRAGEEHGESYYFVSHETFDRMLAAGSMAESVEFNGNRYGVTKMEFERVFATGKPVVVVVEPEGRRQLEETAKREGWNLTRVFINVEPEVQAERFLERFDYDANSNAKFDGVLANYSKRLAIMMTTERAWVADAYSHIGFAASETNYDLVVKAFDQFSQSEIIAVLCSIANLEPQEVKA